MDNILEIEIIKENLAPIYEIYKPLSDEVLITFNNEGLSISMVDPAHVEMVKTLIPISAFENFNLDADHVKLDIGIDINKIKDLCKQLPNGNTLTFIYDADLPQQIICKYGYITRKIGLINIEGFSIPKIPEISFDNKAIVYTKDLFKSLKSLGKDIDVCQLVIKPNVVELLNVYEDNEDRIKSEINDYLEINAKQNSITNFSMDYLFRLIQNINKFNKHIELYNSAEMPLKIISNSDTLKYMCLLAPRVEEENTDYRFDDFEIWDNVEMNNIKNCEINGISLNFDNDLVKIYIPDRYKNLGISSYDNLELTYNHKLISEPKPEPDNKEPDLKPEPEIVPNDILPK